MVKGFQSKLFERLLVDGLGFQEEGGVAGDRYLSFETYFPELMLGASVPGGDRCCVLQEPPDDALPVERGDGLGPDAEAYQLLPQEAGESAVDDPGGVVVVVYRGPPGEDAGVRPFEIPPIVPDPPKGVGSQQFSGALEGERLNVADASGLRDVDGECGDLQVRDNLREEVPEADEDRVVAKVPRAVPSPVDQEPSQSRPSKCLILCSIIPRRL